MAKKQNLKEMIKDLENKNEVEEAIEEFIEEVNEIPVKTLEEVIEEIEKEVVIEKIENEVVEITIINFEKYGFVKKDTNSFRSNFAQMQKYRAKIEEKYGNANWVYLIDCEVYVLLEKKEYAIYE